MSVNYENIATDCDIIEQKIESLMKAINDDLSEKGIRVGDALSKARSAIQEAREGTS